MLWVSAAAESDQTSAVSRLQLPYCRRALSCGLPSGDPPGSAASRGPPAHHSTGRSTSSGRLSAFRPRPPSGEPGLQRRRISPATCRPRRANFPRLGLPRACRSAVTAAPKLRLFRLDLCARIDWSASCGDIGRVRITWARPVGPVWSSATRSRRLCWSGLVCSDFAPRRNANVGRCHDVLVHMTVMEVNDLSGNAVDQVC